MGRVFWRNQGGEPRAYGNFRDYSDVGGKRKEALIPEDAKQATTDPVIAAALADAKVKEYEQRRRSKNVLGVKQEYSLQEYAAHHLVETAKEGRVSRDWLSTREGQLRAAVEFFGNVNLAQITPAELNNYVVWLRNRVWKTSGGNDRKGYSEGTIRHYLNALSGMYTRAESEELQVTNPVARMLNKPVGDAEEAEWLEVDEAATVLETAKAYSPDRSDLANPFVHEIVATMLLTGARESEVYGLEVKDVSFNSSIVRIRTNKWRGLKNKPSARTVPLWPQLHEVLAAYLVRRPIGGRLLFPSPRFTTEGMVTDIRKQLDGIGGLLGYEPGSLRTRVFRHTYCAARLQTLDHGEPVSVYTVAREMGHADTSMVQRVYSHLGDVRKRKTVVEYTL